MFSLEDRLAYKGKAGAVMPPSSLCGKPGERCCRWLRHQQGGTCRAGAFADNTVLLCLSQAAQGASKIPLHIPPAMFRLRGSSGSPAGRVLPGKEASSA